jgi:hypothetical protein
LAQFSFHQYSSANNAVIINTIMIFEEETQEEVEVEVETETEVQGE